MSTAGIFNSSNFAPDQVAPSFSSTVLKYMPNGNAPLFALSSMLPKTVIKNTRHSWFFSSWSMPQVTLATALPAVANGTISQFTAVDLTNIFEGMVLASSTTGEQMLVTGIVGTTVSVRRGVGITMATAIPTGTVLYLIGTSFEESSLRPLASTNSYAEGDNITQIFRNTWALSGTAAAIQLQVGATGKMMTSMKDAMQAHTRDIELSL